MNVNQIQYPMFRIDKIIICGFSAIEKETVVYFDKFTNVIDGPAQDVKHSILLAIDFLLNPSFTDTGLALSCRFKKISENNDNKAYVTLHIKADETFQFNRENGKHLVVARYVSSDHIDSVEYVFGDETPYKKLSIELFHVQLARLRLLRIHDPIVSERTCPSSSDLNKLLVQTITTKIDLKDVQTKLMLAKNDDIECDAVLSILQMEHRNANKAKEYLIDQRTLEAAFLMKHIKDNRKKITEEGHEARAKSHEIKLHLHADQFETNQGKRFALLEKYLQKAHETQFHNDPSDLTEFNDQFNEFLTTWQKHSDDKEMARQIESQVQEYNDTVNMKKTIRHYFNHPMYTIAEFTDTSDKVIDAAERRHQRAYQHEGPIGVWAYRITIPKEMEIQRNQMNLEMDKLKKLEQNFLDKQVENFQKKNEFMECTNRLAFAQLCIEEYFERQNILNPIRIDDWRVGFMALSLKTAYDKNVTESFVGNIFDFIDANIDEQVLMEILPQLFPYFAMFIFKTNAAADTFEILVKPLLKRGNTVYSYVNGDLPISLPYASLADIMLTDETKAKYPSVKNWFDQFCVCTGNISSEILRKQAQEHRCRIIHGTECYHENGTYTEVFNGKQPARIRKVLVEWKKIAEQRDVKLKAQCEKFILDTEMELQEKSRNNNAEKILQAKHSILPLLHSIVHKMKCLFESTEAIDDIEKLILKQKTTIKVYQEKKQLLQAGNPNPIVVVKQMPRVPIVDVIPVLNAIKRFEETSSKISSNISKDVLPLSLDAVNKFKDDIGSLYTGLPKLQTFDYHKQFNTMAVKSQNELNEMCAEVDIEVFTQNVAFMKGRSWLNKLGKIKTYPALVNLDKAKELAEHSYDELQKLKKIALGRVPDGLLLPDLYEEFDLFEKMNEDYEIEIYAKSETNNYIDYDSFWVKTYFYQIVSMLTILNDMVVKVQPNSIIGFELDTCDDRFYIFPDTELNQFDQFTMEKLSDIGTGLTFVSKSNDNDDVIITSDLFDVQINRFCLLFHLMLSTAVNPSMCILNNTIIGHPVDHLQKIIQRFQLVSRFDEPNQELSSRQVIVVSQVSNGYDTLFKQSWKQIWCYNQRGTGIARIIHKDNQISA